MNFAVIDSFGFLGETGNDNSLCIVKLYGVCTNIYYTFSFLYYKWVSDEVAWCFIYTGQK